MELKERYPSLYELLKYIQIRLHNHSCKHIIVQTPTHGNLGDHAIVLAEKAYIEKVFKDKCGEITAENFVNAGKYQKRLVKKNQNIYIPGGGFLGSLWPFEEEMFHRILETFPNNKITVFPQTVFFELNDEEEKAFFEKSRQIYEKHKDLHIFVRDKKSLDFMTENMPNVKCNLVPDIVCSYHPKLKQAKERNDILICMRQDKEMVLSSDSKQKILLCLKKKYPKEVIRYTDTVESDKHIKSENREDEVLAKLYEFATCKLVITDRLHGMVFAAITNTPCIAFGNVNGKVKGVYRWISDNSYIKYVDDIGGFENALNEIDIDKDFLYNYDRVVVNYKALDDYLCSIERVVK